MKDFEPIKFPILFRYDDMSVPSGTDIVQIWGFKHRHGNIYTAPESSVKPEADFEWLIDADGKFRKTNRIETERTWARPLRHFVSLVTGVYEVLPGERVTVDFVTRALEGTRLDPEKSLTEDCLRFLSEFHQDTTFTRDMFLDLMNENPDSSFETYPS